jgi:hypothetical protein
MKMPAPEGLLGMPKGKSSEPAGSDMDDAAQDILDAIKDGDAAALGSALRRAYECCSGGEDDSEEE